MKKSLFKDTFREINKSPNRFLSIFLIVALGTAFFSGVKAAAPNMKNTADIYYDDNNLMDIRILSTMGLTDDDMEAMKQVEGVETVQPSYFADVVTTIYSNEFVFRIHALPADKIQSGSGDYLNKPNLIEGRMPAQSGECIIEQSYNIDLGLKIGDKLTVSSGKKEDLTDVLVTDTFTIVGKAVSSYYLTYDKDPSDIGSGKVNFFMMILSTDFSYPVYTEALVTVKGAKALNSYSPEYQKLVEKTLNQLDNVVSERSLLRLAEIKEMANEQLNESKEELATKEGEYNTQIADGQAQLDAAQDQLIEGQLTLNLEKQNFQQNIAAAQQQIRDGEIELAEGQAEYDSALLEYNDAQSEFGDLLTALDDATTALNQIDSSSTSQIAELDVRLATESLTSVQRADLLEQQASLMENQQSAREGLAKLNDANSSAKSAMTSSKAKLDQAAAKIEQGKKDLAKAKRDLAAAKVEAAAKFAAAEREIADGQAEYDASKADFDQKKADGKAELDDGKEQVIRAENQIEMLSKPNYYVLDRSKLYSYADYAATADRMDAIARIFPLFFLFVAVLVCLTTMTRMVDEQRGTIGAFKALGYNKSEIIFKYVFYSSLASALGGIIGVNIGVRTFPRVIFDSWSMMYTLPPMQAVSQTFLMIGTVIAGIAVTTISAYIACNQELIATPALLMRPKAPKAGKTILIEKFRSLWKHLSFSQKVTARNLFRYKKRFFMTIIGIAGCSALLVAGFGLSNSISQIVDRQFKQIFTYNLSLRYVPTVTEEDKTAVIDSLSQKSEISSWLNVAEMNAKFKSTGDEIAVTLICPENKEDFLNYIFLRERVSQKQITLGMTGLVITEKLAKELGVKVGDAVTVNNGDGAIKKLEISGITENYIFHYAYISTEYYSQIFRLPPKNNSVLVKLNQTTKEIETRLGSELIEMEQVASVMYYSDVAVKFQETVKSLDAIVYVIILSAGMLAFVVLYNLTNINLGERIREIATIKVLGFYNREVAAYVYRENIILSIIGAGVGLGLGILLHRTIMTSIEQNGIMFGDYIANISFLFAFAITIVFTMLVNIFMYRRLKNIPMVESLKAVE